MVSVKAAATGRVSWGPMVSGLGPLEHPKTHINTSDTAITSPYKTVVGLYLTCLKVGFTHRGQNSSKIIKAKPKPRSWIWILSK